MRGSAFKIHPTSSTLDPEKPDYQLKFEFQTRNFNLAVLEGARFCPFQLKKNETGDTLDVI